MRISMLRAAGLAALVACTWPAMANQSRSDDLELRTLAVHNRERHKLGLKPLIWDASLAADASVWAAHLARTGILEHSPDDHSDLNPQGENLWAGTAGIYSVDAMSELWARERQDYKPGTFPNSSKSGDLDAVGHYTQMVWRSTTKVGCARERGREDDFFVCRYSEGGNVIGERPF